MLGPDQQNLWDSQNPAVETSQIYGRPTTRRGDANLPAGLDGKASDGHLVRRATRTRRRALIGVVRLAAGALGELYDETLAHELGAVCDVKKAQSVEATYGNLMVSLSLSLKRGTHWARHLGHRAHPRIQ
jgi:hypothetical protein